MTVFLASPYIVEYAIILASAKTCKNTDLGIKMTTETDRKLEY